MAQNVDVQVIAWHRFKERMEQLLNQCRASMDVAAGEEMYRLQGEARAYKKLLNLPESLALIEDEDRRVEEEKREHTKGRKRDGQARQVAS